MPPEWTWPTTECLDFQGAPDTEEGILEFRLSYDGPLLSGQSKAASHEKNRMRKYFHFQLRELWNQDKNLKEYSRVSVGEPRGKQSYLEMIGDRYAIAGTKYVPLITKASGFWCSLNILFLRRDVPGNLIGNCGDLDNRLKVLFDGLRRAEPNDNVPIETDPDFIPTYCLLEDDKLITSLSVTSDRLLNPIKFGEEGVGDIKLVIHVQTSSFIAPPVSSFSV